MALVEVGEVKAFLKIAESDDSNNAFIAAMIPEVEGAIKKYCETEFKGDAGEDSFPAGLKLIASKMISHDLQQADSDGVKSYKLGDYSETRNDNSDYPQSIYKALDKFKVREIKFI